MTFQIQKLEQKDLQAVAAPLAQLLRGLNYFSRLKAETPGETEAHVTRHLALCLGDGSHSVYLAREPEGRILGYASVHWLPYLFLNGPEGYLSELFVSAPARGEGLGGRLLEAVVAEARQRGCARLSLINMRERESYLRGFYLKHGWEERPEAANFILPLPPG